MRFILSSAILSILVLVFNHAYSAEQVRVQLKWKHQFQFAGYYAAIKEGYYQERGLDVVLIQGNPGINNTDFIKNDIQYFVDLPSAFVLNRGKRKDVLLAAIFQHSPVALYSLKSAGIRTVHDVVDRQVMLPDRLNLEILAMFKNEGLNISNLHISSLKWGVSPLITGEADVISGYRTDMPFLFEEAGVAYHEILPDEYGLDFYGDCLFATHSEAVFYPKRVDRFLEASIMGWQYAMSHKEEMVQFIYSNYSQRLSIDALRFEADAMDALIMPEAIEIGHINKLRIKKILEIHRSLGLEYDIKHIDNFIYPRNRHNNQIFFVVFGLVIGFVVALIFIKFWNRQLQQAVSTAISGQKRTEKNYLEIFNTTTNAIFVHDGGTGRILEVNDTVLSVFGYQDKMIFHGESPPHISSGQGDFTHENIMKKIIQCSETDPQVFEWQARRANGGIFWVEITLKAYTLEGKNRVLAIYKDIDEKKQAEQAREENLRIMGSFIETLPGMAMLMGRDMRIILVNDAMCDSLNRSKEQIIGAFMEDVLSEPVYRRRVRQVKTVFDTGVHKQWEDEKDGRYFYNFITPVYSNADVVEHVTVFSLDITQRKIFEKYNTRLANALEQSAEAISIITKEGIVEYINPAFEKIFNLKKDGVIGRPPGYLLQDVWDEKSGMTPEQAMGSHQVWQGIMTQKTEDNGILELNTSITPIFQYTEMVGFVAIQRDETMLRRLSADLRQSQKMEAIGTLAGGIAHDFNNILVGIMGYTEMAQMLSNNSESLKEYLNQVYLSALRAKELVEQILAFSRKSDHSKAVMQVKAVIQEAVKLLRSSIPTTIDIQAHTISTRAIIGNATQIHQIIMNLGANAYHAMLDGGIITISLEEKKAEYLEIPHDIVASAEDYLCLEVTDTGTGIPPSLLKKVFEPYFTTKDRGKGTGMGLSVVQRIVRNHDGFIHLSSEIDRGTSVKIYFPAVSQSEAEAHITQSNVHAQKNIYSIMFIDDEVTIVNLVEQYLSTQGHQVKVFSDASEAEEEIRNNLHQYDLVISDQIMPYMTGVELLHVIRKIDEHKPIVLTSGNVSDIPVEAKCMVLEKPMNLVELDKVIRKAMS